MGAHQLGGRVSDTHAHGDDVARPLSAACGRDYNSMHSWTFAPLTVVAFGSLTIAACGAARQQTPPTAAAPPLPRGTLRQNLASATAKVKEIAVKTREVTVERDDGSVVEVLPGDEERNLDHVNVGNDVTVTRYDSLTYEVTKPSERGSGLLLMNSAGQPQLAKPGEAQIRVITVAVPIVDIDVAAHTLTMRTPDNQLTILGVGDDLSHVAVGDLVTITYTEALAFSFGLPPPK